MGALCGLLGAAMITYLAVWAFVPSSTSNWSN